jgi:hypothetical protein
MVLMVETKGVSLFAASKNTASMSLHDPTSAAIHSSEASFVLISMRCQASTDMLAY